jgi:hypothetical protein
MQILMIYINIRSGTDDVYDTLKRQCAESYNPLVVEYERQREADVLLFSKSEWLASTASLPGQDVSRSVLVLLSPEQHSRVLRTLGNVNEHAYNTAAPAAAAAVAAVAATDAISAAVSAAAAAAPPSTAAAAAAAAAAATAATAAATCALADNIARAAVASATAALAASIAATESTVSAAAADAAANATGYAGVPNASAPLAAAAAASAAVAHAASAYAAATANIGDNQPNDSPQNAPTTTSNTHTSPTLSPTPPCPTSAIPPLDPQLESPPPPVVCNAMGLIKPQTNKGIFDYYVKDIKPIVDADGGVQFDKQGLSPFRRWHQLVLVESGACPVLFLGATDTGALFESFLSLLESRRAEIRVLTRSKTEIGLVNIIRKEFSGSKAKAALAAARAKPRDDCGPTKVAG